MPMQNYTNDVEGFGGTRIEIDACSPEELLGTGVPGVTERHVALNIQGPGIAGMVRIALSGPAADKLSLCVAKASGTIEQY